MTKLQLAKEVSGELAPWAKSFGSKLAAYTLAGYLAGCAATGPRGAVLGFGIGGLYVSIVEFIELYKGEFGS